MKLATMPRQPFVGLAAMAAVGIIFAEFFSLSSFVLTALTIFTLVCAIAVLYWPRLVATYVIVGAGFFLLHNFTTRDTEASSSSLNFATGHQASKPTAQGLPNQRFRRKDLRTS